MNSYLVTWTIDIDADSPREAAEVARSIQLDRASDALVFTVENGDEAVEIDLS